MSTLAPLWTRLKDPGSIRSLVLVLFLFKGQAVNDVAVQGIVDFILMVIGTVSFFMQPATSVSAAATIQAAHNAATTVAAVVAESTGEAVAKAQEAVSNVQGVATQVEHLAASVRSLTNLVK